MVFSNLEFMFLYLPAVIILYFITPLKFRNLMLFVVSLIFYGWGEPVYVFIMVFSIVINYVCGHFVSKYMDDNPKRAKKFILITVVANLLILGVFKYTDFIIGNLRLIPFLSFLQPVGLNLPIGISFYTFQMMSYTFDIYRRDANKAKNIVNFGAYVVIFPALIAGPIVRYRDIDNQLNARKESVIMFAAGIRTFTAGLCKKVLLANTAGAYWEYVQGLPQSDMSTVTAWFGIIMYTFQIYFDFSGYSDMAIGLGKMFGFTFLENFNYPYIAKSITDFWRRWHISLSIWFRDYVYFTLGGNRRGLLIQYRNIAVVWFLTGFWHGASWNYILWGAYFGVILMLEKGFLLKALEKVPAFVQHLYAVVLIIFGWVLFTFEDMSKGAKHITYMFGAGNKGFIDSGAVYDLIHYLPFVIICVIACLPAPKRLFGKLFEKSKAFRYAVPAAVASMILFCIAVTVDSTFSPFLYLRF